MTAKIIPIFDNPGFFGGCNIGNDEAPKEIVENKELSYDYYAVVWKYGGSVEAMDFLRLARRLTTLCFQVYGRATTELRADSRASFNFLVAPGVMPDNHVSDPRFDVCRLNYNAFRIIFASSFSVGLRIAQRPSRSGNSISHALIEWNASKPDLLFINTQRGDLNDLRTGDGQLENLLVRKLFNVPGAPPNNFFDVNLGFENWNDAMMEQ